MKREIGSEFWDVPLGTGVQPFLFPKDTGFFLSGRSALNFLIEEIQARQTFHSVALPSYCCETMIEPFLTHGVAVEPYPVVYDETGQMVQMLPQTLHCDGILVMDYFGYVRQTMLPKYGGVIIRDVTHSLFCGIPSDADYVFGSLRKWAGFWTGGYAWSREGAFQMPLPVETNQAYVELRHQAMREKIDYLYGSRPNKHYLSVFAQAEKLLEKDSHGASDPRDVEYAKKMDMEFIRARRRENAATLLKVLSDFALFPKLQNSDCPLFVPIRVTGGKRDELRKYLVEQKIYCPVHWPVSSKHSLTDKTRILYDEELSLMCDQRYGQADMNRMYTTILRFFEQEKL